MKHCRATHYIPIQQHEMIQGFMNSTYTQSPPGRGLWYTQSMPTLLRCNFRYGTVESHAFPWALCVVSILYESKTHPDSMSSRGEFLLQIMGYIHIKCGARTSQGGFVSIGFDFTRSRASRPSTFFVSRVCGILTRSLLLSFSSERTRNGPYHTKRNYFFSDTRRRERPM